MLEHDPEKWEPVFGKRSCSNKEGDDDSKKNNPTLMTAPAPVMVPEPPPGEAFVKLEKVMLTYGRGEHRLKALEETDLVVDKGDFVALVGPSGCGKSTILKLVTGLIPATSGYVFVAGREVGAEPVRVGMAFQNPTLLPWLRLRDNVMLPLKIVPPFRQQYRAKRRNEFRDRIEALLEQVGLKGFSDKYPWQLSGGMLQRASLCRALVHEPQLLMLDEPFGALDQFTREELWSVMQGLWMKLRPTVILVTHDLKEATYLANRICVMQARPGRIINESVVPFARPRTIAMSYDPQFAALTQRLRELIFGARPASEATP
jgi:NitT/TauT family transport system ATP-binding protein